MADYTTHIRFSVRLSSADAIRREFKSKGLSYDEQSSPVGTQFTVYLRQITDTTAFTLTMQQIFDLGWDMGTVALLT